MSATDARQNEHLEPNISVASASAAVFQQPAKSTLPADDNTMTRAAKRRVDLGCNSQFQLAQTQHDIHFT
jgi:hypothetical protein